MLLTKVTFIKQITNIDKQLVVYVYRRAVEYIKTWFVCLMDGRNYCICIFTQRFDGYWLFCGCVDMVHGCTSSIGHLAQNQQDRCSKCQWISEPAMFMMRVLVLSWCYVFTDAVLVIAQTSNLKKSLMVNLHVHCTNVS